MTRTVPTVTIEDPFKPGDFRIINESDYDPKTHRLWNAQDVPDAEAPDAPEIPRNWRSMKYFALRALAQHFTEKPIDNKATAVKVIEAELARR